jgi:hypothetical protein
VPMGGNEAVASGAEHGDTFPDLGKACKIQERFGVSMNPGPSREFRNER